MATATATDKGYRFKLDKPVDSEQVERERGIRWFVLIICTIAMLALPTGWLWYLGSLFEHPVLGGLLGFGLGGYLASNLVPDHFLINNPEWTAFVTQNAFNGKMIPYGPGLHPSLPWEGHSKDGNYPLKVITRSFEANVSTATSKVKIAGEYEYAMSLRNITVAIGIDETTIQSGITAFIESFLISECTQTGRDAEWARSHIKELNKALADEFMNREADGNKPDSFEKRFGFITVSIVISSVALPDKVQATRDAIDEARQLHEVVATMYGMSPETLKQKVESKEISKQEYDKMLNRAMATSDNATMTIAVVEGSATDLASKIVQKLS